MNVRNYFKEDTTSYADMGLIVYDFDDSKMRDFIKDCILPFRKAYISDESLHEEELKGPRTKKETIIHRLPTKPFLKSGEFGEILMLFIAYNFRYRDANIVPLKWQWKEHQDMPNHLTDVIMLRCEDEANPQESDYISTIEVKSISTDVAPSKLRERAEDAVDGAIKDKDERMGKTIIYLMNQYSRDKNYDSEKLVGRFKDPVTNPYSKNFNAAIVIDRTSLHKLIENVTDDILVKASSEGIGLFIVPMKEMKGVYEEIYDRMPCEG